MPAASSVGVRATRRLEQQDVRPTGQAGEAATPTLRRLQVIAVSLAGHIAGAHTGTGDAGVTHILRAGSYSNE